MSLCPLCRVCNTTTPLSIFHWDTEAVWEEEEFVLTCHIVLYSGNLDVSYRLHQLIFIAWSALVYMWYRRYIFSWMRFISACCAVVVPCCVGGEILSGLWGANKACNISAVYLGTMSMSERCPILDTIKVLWYWCWVRTHEFVYPDELIIHWFSLDIQHNHHQ